MSIGWWLGKSIKGQAWVPSAYVEEQAARAPAPRAPPPPPAANGRAKPTPPAPPAKRPAAGRKPAGLQARDSGMSLNGAENGASSSNPNLAGSLADALLARKQAMQKRDDEDDGW